MNFQERQQQLKEASKPIHPDYELVKSMTSYQAQQYSAELLKGVVDRDVEAIAKEASLNDLIEAKLECIEQLKRYHKIMQKHPDVVGTLGVEISIMGYRVKAFEQVIKRLTTIY